MALHSDPLNPNVQVGEMSEHTRAEVTVKVDEAVCDTRTCVAAIVITIDHEKNQDEGEGMAFVMGDETQIAAMLMGVFDTVMQQSPAAYQHFKAMLLARGISEVVNRKAFSAPRNNPHLS